MKSVYLKNVRCFASPRSVPIAPITLLVGENSTGKSSFLALSRIAAELVRGNLAPNFNADPFFLGAYDQVAHFRGGKYGRARAFEIGAEIPLRGAKSLPPIASVRAEFAKRGSQPRVASFSVEAGPYCFEVHPSASPTEDVVPVRIRTPSWTGPLPTSALRRLPQEIAIDFRFFSFLIMQSIDKLGSESSSNTPPMEEIETLQNIVRSIGLYRLSPFAVAPVRTKPARTYNPIDDTPTSEGSHVPMTLAKTFFTDRTQWLTVKHEIDEFGRASGMFEELGLRPLGKSDSDPFQIIVKIMGPPSNLIDVGYGVSQVLPIIVDLIMNKRGRIYLLQQPEVHLHPRAQAGLGSFLATIAARQNVLLVETHSDYILDRIRMDVRDKKVRAGDCLILYFERQGFEIVVSPINIEDDGNLVDPPRSYRSFFLEEERRLLGV